MRVVASRLPTWPQALEYPARPVVYAIPRQRLGQYFQAATAVAGTAAQGATGQLGFSSTGQALSTSGTIVSTTGAITAAGIALMGTAPIPVVGWVAAAVGALLTIASMFFGGKPQLSHAQREALEVQRVGGTVNAMIGQIRSSLSLDELWAILKSWQSGYVGGTSSVAVPIYFRAPGGDQGDPAAEVAMRDVMLALIASGGIILPFHLTPDQILATYTNYTGAMGATWPGKQNQWYPVFTEQGFYSLFEQHPDWIRANTQAGVTRSMLDPINVAVRNALLNQLQNLGFHFTPGGGGAQLLASAPPAPAGLDPAMVTSWVTQAYQQLLGRAPSSAELSGAVAALMAQQMTAPQFLTTLTSSAEFQLAHGTTATVTPSGTVVVGGAATSTGQPLSTYWWQNALLAPTGLTPLGAQPVMVASMLPPSAAASTLWDSITQHPWLAGLGALTLIGLVAIVAKPPTRRRR